MLPTSHADHAAPDPLPAVPAAPTGGRSGTTWAVAVLTLGTLLLVGYLAVLWVAAALVTTPAVSLTPCSTASLAGSPRRTFSRTRLSTNT